jgi:hypothetical protein
MQSLIKVFDQFFFSLDSGHSLSISRIAVGALFLVMLVLAVPQWLLFYGPIPINIQIGYSLFSLVESQWWSWLIWWLAALSSIAIICGFYSSYFLLILYLVQRSMIHYSPQLTNGQDQVLSIVLFCLMFANVDAHFTVHKRSPHCITQLIWPRRLAQMLFSIMYFSAAITKPLNDYSWIDGTAMSYVVLSERWFQYPESTFFTTTLFSYVSTYCTLAIEFLLPFLVWIPRLRLIVVLFGILLHLSICLLFTEAVLFFNLATLTWIILFLDKEDFTKIHLWVIAIQKACTPVALYKKLALQVKSRTAKR